MWLHQYIKLFFKTPLAHITPPAPISYLPPITPLAPITLFYVRDELRIRLQATQRYVFIFFSSQYTGGQSVWLAPKLIIICFRIGLNRPGNILNFVYILYLYIFARECSICCIDRYKSYLNETIPKSNKHFILRRCYAWGYTYTHMKIFDCICFIMNDKWSVSGNLCIHLII